MTGPHLTRSVMEGVTFGLMDSPGAGAGDGPARWIRVRVSGGGARSPLWRQMMADVFGAEVVTVNVTQGAAFGAALLAGVGAGVFPSVEEAARGAVEETSVTRPGADAAAYEGAYREYRALYPALKPRFAALTGLA